MKHLLVLLVLAVASVGWCADPKVKSEKALNGRWTPESAVLAGKPLPDEIRKAIQLTLANGKYAVKAGDQVDEGTYTVDATKSPKTITIVGTNGPNKGKTILGIYEVEKGTLKVCYDMSGKAHPESFESKPDSQLFLATYARQKMAKRGGRSFKASESN